MSVSLGRKQRVVKPKRSTLIKEELSRGMAVQIQKKQVTERNKIEKKLRQRN